MELLQKARNGFRGVPGYPWVHCGRAQPRKIAAARQSRIEKFGRQRQARFLQRARC